METKDGQLLFEKPIISPETYRLKTIQASACSSLLLALRKKIELNLIAVRRVEQYADICEEYQLLYDFGLAPAHSFEEYKAAVDFLKKWEPWPDVPIDPFKK